MDRATQIDQIKKFFDQIDNNVCTVRDSYALNDAKDYFSSADQLAKEREIIFRDSPVVVGYSDQVRNRGDFFASMDTGVPILVVRSQDGELRGFLNSCTHRGSAVEMEPCGSGRKVFSCPWHGWNYRTDGTLAGVPDSWGFPDLDKQEYCLTSLPVAERHGMVWAVCNPALELDLDEFLGPVDEELQEYNLDEFEIYETNRRELDMNWKLALDTFGEAYHVRFLHKDTGAHLFYSTTITCESFGRHTRMGMALKSLEQLRDVPEEDWNLHAHVLYAYLMYPNIAMSWTAENLAIYRMYPLGDDPSRSVVYTTLLRHPDSTRSEAEWEHNMKFLIDVTEEDFSMAPSAQAALNTGLKQKVVYGTFEAPLIGIHTQFRKALGLEPLSLIEPAGQS
jgi:phenylpropionate dioxygenase-like ring-hydroxylating dioxygenase large terminal subunit